jgi:hypothetical protein
MSSEHSSEKAGMSSEEASRVIKRLAENQKVSIELTQDQLDALLKQWDDANPREPAQISFYVDRKELANLTVAGYRYRGDTCCV